MQTPKSNCIHLWQVVQIQNMSSLHHFVLGKNTHTYVTNRINLLNSTGYVMHQQFNIQQLYVLPTHSIYVFCIYLRTKSDLCHLHHKLIGFYNREEKCLQRGMNWVFK